LAERPESMNEKRQIRRGDIYFADLPEETVGSVQAGRRPVLITQNDRINERAPTVLVATVTSVIKRLDLRTHVLLPKIKGLPRRSMVMTEQRYTLDKSNLKDYRCTLPDETMKEVDRAIRYAEQGSRRSLYRRRR
jgi:mRNA interferase MazF